MDIRTGNILISDPFMFDGVFKDTIIIVGDYSRDEGTVGFILNNPIDLRVDELIKDFPNDEHRLYLGGPVGQDSIHYIHTRGDLFDQATEISPGVFWGGNFDKLKVLIEKELISTNEIKFFVGYSGWSPGQLEGELKDHAWMVDKMDVNYLKRVPDRLMWKKCMKLKGQAFEIIANMDRKAILN